MKILFAHDHIFLKNSKNEIYSPGGLREEILDDYLQLGTELKIISRVKLENDKQKLNPQNQIKSSRINFLFLNSLSSLKSLFFMDSNTKKVLKEEIDKSDIIFTRLPSEIGNVVFDIAEECNKVVIVEVVASAKESLWYLGGVKAKIYSFVADYRMKKRVSRAKNVLYVADFFKNKYLSKGNKIVCSDAKIDKDISVVKLKSSDKRISKLGIIASLNSKIKGIELILKALHILQAKGIELTIEIVGSGNTQNLEKIAKKLNIIDNVTFKGTLSKREIFNWLDTLDIYIQPSYTEGLSRATLEAMSRGLPVIASNVGGFSELLDDEFLIPKGDYKILAKKIENFYLNKYNNIKEGLQNYKKFEEYEFKILKEKKQKFYNSILMEKKV